MHLGLLELDFQEGSGNINAMLLQTSLTYLYLRNKEVSSSHCYNDGQLREGQGCLDVTSTINIAYFYKSGACVDLYRHVCQAL